MADNKDLINLRQHKLDLPEYYQKFKSLNKVVGELQQSDHGSPFIDIICCKTNVVPSSLSSDDKIKLVIYGEDQMLAMQLIMNADRDMYGTLIRKK